jgi:hypothetical protein
MSQVQKFRRIALAVASVVPLTACSYDVTFNDCQVRCTGSGDCPDGFTCQANLCRAAGMSGACGAPGTTTLRQTADDKIDKNLMSACTNADGTTTATSWYRVFSLAENGITGSFAVDKVTVGIATSSGMLTVQAKVGSYGAAPGPTLDESKISMIGMASAAVPDTQITELVAIPITATVPAGNLIAEIDAPELNGTGNSIELGSTDAAQTHDPYIKAPRCGENVPTTTGTAMLANARIVLTVEGSEK